MTILSNQFTNREDHIRYIREHFPHLNPSDHHVSPIQGGHRAGQVALQRINPIRYGKTRDYLNGAVTRLSPYIRHGVLNLVDVRQHALTLASPTQAESFIQELTWREYWRRVLMGCWATAFGRIKSHTRRAIAPTTTPPPYHATFDMAQQIPR
ncbi:MAG UNVERIFIED_CONTAM: hypothetical protein LVT10_01695 [Anaerolineae bacterium]